MSKRSLTRIRPDGSHRTVATKTSMLFHDKRNLHKLRGLWEDVKITHEIVSAEFDGLDSATCGCPGFDIDPVPYGAILKNQNIPMIDRRNTGIAQGDYFMGTALGVVHGYESFVRYTTGDVFGNGGNTAKAWTPRSAGSQSTYLYPDDPQHKMLYRPWRSIVDAAVAKELRYTFLNTGDDVAFAAGPLGIRTIGEPKPFRFEELVNAGEADQFILEKASSKTRMVDPSNRSILTFAKVSLLDPTSLRHVIVDVATLINADSMPRAMSHAASAGGTAVYTRSTIRDIQAGRQLQRLS
jgi:hypothetical protein